MLNLFHRRNLHATIVSFCYMALLVFVALLFAPNVGALQSSSLSLDITPSPFAINIRPDASTTLEIQIRNAGKSTERLKVEPKIYKVDKNGNQDIDNVKQPDFSSWITIKSPTFTLEPGQWFNQEIIFQLPKDSKFNYPFILLVSRDQDEAKSVNNSTLKDAVQIPVLINVDRPGQVRKLEVQKFSHSSGTYANQPVNFEIKIKNTGNMLVQIKGNIVMQRSSHDKKPLATIPISTNKEYVVPGSTRTFTVTWKNGQKNAFPVGGSYTAKLVAVYNDGLRDIQIQREVTFWLLPEQSLIVTVVVFILTSIALVVWLLRRKKHYSHIPRKKRKSNRES